MTRLPKEIASIAGVCDVETFPPAGTNRPSILIELPHAATRERDFDRLRARLDPGLPADLKDFFFVNTDAGSYEYGAATARMLAESGLSVLLVRCRIPRTFVDCNRIVDGTEDGERGTKGDPEHGITAAVPDYICRPEDLETLLALHRAYQNVAGQAYELVCGSGGLALTLHTYAPKTVGIDTIDEGIGAAIRRAYEPDLYATWPVRPDVDVICSDEEGRMLAPRGLVDRLKGQFGRIGIESKENATYCLHSATMGWKHSFRYPGQVLCMEASRALLADPFTPFAEMTISAEKALRIARPLAAACLEHVSSSPH